MLNNGQQSMQAGNFHSITNKNITKVHVKHGNSITFHVQKITINGKSSAIASIQTGSYIPWYDATIDLTDAVAVCIWYNGSKTSSPALYYFS
jgi:hypothetical protein